MIRALGILALLMMAAVPAGAEPLPSGTAFLGDEMRARQSDDAANPGMLWVADGAALWRAKAGAADKSCADCHQEAARSMRGVATRYPAVDAASGKLLNLEGRINRCRSDHQKAEPFAYETDELLALTAFVARQSKGLPMNVATDGAARPFYEQGRAFFYRRRGQLNLACAHCHVENAGRRLRGNVISHGLPVGYPAYRLTWQTMGSLHRRLRSCSFGLRATRHPHGSDDYLALELYLAKRAEGVAVETPAIRP